MRTRYVLVMIFSVSMILMIIGRVSSQTKLPGPPMEGDERLIPPLVNAGIALNEASLVHALKNDNPMIASSAALALSRFPKTRRTVRGLRASVRDERESVAMSAVYSLLKLGEKTGWSRVVIQRLPRIHDRAVQVQMAGLLAQAGRSEGWKVIISIIKEDEVFAVLALEFVNYFDGVKDQAGKQIRVAEELDKLLDVVPENTRRQIEKKLGQLRTGK